MKGAREEATEGWLGWEEEKASQYGGTLHNSLGCIDLSPC